jgi:CRP-like cAMP-binding protein
MVSEPDFWEVSWQIDGQEFDALRSASEEISFEAQQVICKVGEPADCMYLIEKGYGLAVLGDNTGAERGVSVIPEGQSFGELGLLMGQPRTATVTAGTDLKALKITLESLKTLEQKQPHIAAILYKKLARTLAEQLLAKEI